MNKKKTIEEILNKINSGEFSLAEIDLYREELIKLGLIAKDTWQLADNNE